MVARLDRDGVGIAQRLLTLRGKADVLDNEYLLYFLQSSIGQSLLKARETGTTVTGIKQAEFRKIQIDIPEIGVQKKIGGFLGLLEQKIELNNKINKNLEQQAQAIFKSWFIDFEPFSNRKPSDWSVSTLGNISIMGAGGDKPQNVSPIKTDLYEYPIYSNGLSNEGLYGFTDKPKISEESVTVSARGTIGFVCLRHIPYVPIVRLVTLIPKTEIVSAKYLYLWLKQLHITGTGTTQQQLTVPDFQKTEILVPSQEIVTLFTATVEPIFEKIWANQNENEKLSSLRDTL
ncbi:restriction endonuclease subunit S, partial [Clostridiales Family XIII bacterium BX16]|nr:restriction endonuclease subunit S [Lentihominibacter faecis]